MNREPLLAAAVLAVVAAAALTAALVPGVIADPERADPAPERDGRVSVEEVTIAAGEVTGETAALSVDTYLAHRGGPVENVTVVLRATDTNTGLVEATRELEVGTLERDAERRVPGTLTVPRRSDYRIETLVYRNGTRTESTSQRVAGVGTLTPAYADTDVGFHRFGAGYGLTVGPGSFPAVEYAVESTDGDRATLSVTSYLTNAGDEPESDLRLEVKARQSGSNVVADAAAIDLGSLAPGATATPTTEITVPEGYDYYLDAVLWKNGAVVETTRAPANLGPGNLTVEETADEGGIEVGDFERQDGDGRTEPDRGEASNDAADGQPGLGVAAAALALLAVAAVAARRTQP